MSDFVLVHELGEDAQNTGAAPHGGVCDSSHKPGTAATVYKRPLARGKGGAELGGEVHELGGVAGRRATKDADAKRASCTCVCG